MTNETIQIAMLGPSGVGKTSLLSALRHEIKTIDQGKYEFKCTDTQRSAQLDQIDKNMREIENLQAWVPNRNNVGAMIGTPQINYYPFVLKHHQKEIVTIDIMDHRGGDFSAVSKNGEKNQQLVEALRKSDVIIDVLDASYMMADDDGTYDASVNQYSTINQHITDRLDAVPNKNLLIIFALTKCEKWARPENKNKDDLKKLLDRAENRLKQTLNTINEHEKKNNNVVAVITPVITINAVEYQRYETEIVNGKKVYTPIFIKNAAYPFKPQVSLPLHLALAFSMSQKIEDGGIFKDLMNRIWGKQATRSEIQQVLNQFNEYKLKELPERQYGSRKLLNFSNQG
jgi:GTPase SAR1 family protein